MFDTGAIRGFVNDLQVNVTGLTDAQAVDLMVRAANEVKADVIAQSLRRSGALPALRQIVDGNIGAPFSSVRPDGMIVLAWSYGFEVVLDTYNALHNRLPKLTGRAQASIIVMVDGVEMPPEHVPSDFTEARLIVTVPYARRLEVGRKAKTHEPFSKMGWHAVQETAIVAKRLLGSLADVSFTYSDLSDAYELQTEAALRRREWSHARQQWRRDAKPRRNPGFKTVERHVRYPTIVIRPRSA